MKCMNPKCDNEVTGKAKTCSNRCRVVLHRSVTPKNVTLGVDKAIKGASVTKNALRVTPEQAANDMLSQPKGTLDPETRATWQYHKDQHRPTVYPSTEHDYTGLTAASLPE